MKTIQEKTKEFLAVSGWSQERLAKEIGVTRANLNRFLHHQKRESVGEKVYAFLLKEKGMASTKREDPLSA